jgi:type I restriction enzyme, R subunit
MSPTDTSEKGLESIIVGSLVAEAEYIQGAIADYDRDHAIDIVKLSAFIKDTQPKAFESLSFESDNPRRTKFLHRLQGEIAKSGVIDVLRTGVQDGAVNLQLFYGTPSEKNPKAVELFKKNIFSVTRQAAVQQ